MIKEGKIIVCDRCNKTIILEKNEAVPKDWRSVEDRDLCHSCAEDFDKFWENPPLKRSKI